MTLYCGIDLHANNVVVSIVNENDIVVFEKRLPNEINGILCALKPYQSDLFACVVESTYNWFWLIDGLMEAGLDVRLANTAAIVQYNGIKHTNDQTDARFLAHLLRLGILPEGHIYPKELRYIRDLLRRRLLLVQQCTLQHLSLHSLICRHIGIRLTNPQIKALDSKKLAGFFSDKHVLLAAQTACYLMKSIQQSIDAIEEEILTTQKNRKEYEILTSIKGVGKIIGLTILLETGNIDRFASPGNYASYARCVNTEKISNGKVKGRGNSKNGNRYLNWAFMEAAHYAAIWDPMIKKYYQRKKEKTHIMVAKKALANKLARACYHMLKDGVIFDLNKAFA
jgi:transposase